MSLNTVILADGSFPVHETPLGFLRNACRIVCCDGSAANLVKAGFEPWAIVGDLDSLDKSVADRYSDRLYRDNGQDTNDLTKAVCWCLERNLTGIVIIGATGKREDHNIGNISLLAEYVKDLNVIMVTDTGVLTPYLNSCRIKSFPGQQVSIFSIDTSTEISSAGLKFQLKKMKLTNWWKATLNESTGDSFELFFDGGPVIVFQKFRD